MISQTKNVNLFENHERFYLNSSRDSDVESRRAYGQRQIYGLSVTKVLPCVQ